VSDRIDAIELSEDIRGDQVTADLQGAYKSVYFDSTKDMGEALDKVSPSFCLAKWFNVSIHIPTGRTHSCYHPPVHRIPMEELEADASALHNTKHKKKQREMMLKGERPKECSFCWDIEDTGNISDRPYRSFDVNEPGIIAEALKYGSDGNPLPKYMEVNFNQACNFKCTYCSPHLSTEWHKEIRKHGPYKLEHGNHNDTSWMEKDGMLPNNRPDNPYLKAFWEYFPEAYSNLQTFRMTGGEPLMDKNTFKIFDYVKKNPSKKLHLSITSNCNPPKQELWDNFISDLKEITDARAIDHFMLFCSLDSWGKQAEYIRPGMDFDVLHKNIRTFLIDSECHSLTFIATMNILSLPGWMKYITNIYNLRNEINTDRQLIWFDTPMLHDPRWMSLKLATPEMLQPLLDSIMFMEENKETQSNRFKGFKDYEIDKVRRLYEWAREPMDERNTLLAKKNFAVYFKQKDERQGTNLKETFPEFETFIEECERLAWQNRDYTTINSIL